MRPIEFTIIVALLIAILANIISTTWYETLLACAFFGCVVGLILCIYKYTRRR